MKNILYLVSIIVLLLSCDESESEVNIGKEVIDQNAPYFEIEFDNRVFKTANAKASVIDGVVTINATDVKTHEIFIVQLNNDKEDTYTLSPNDYVGKMVYKNNDEISFYTSPYSYSGRIDLLSINFSRFLLFGKFSFTGIRLVPMLNPDGTTVLDLKGNPRYTQEIKNFTNGSFTNIPFSISDAIDTTLDKIPDNMFYVKIENQEFVETSIQAYKTKIGDVEVIKFKISNSSKEFEMQVPASALLAEEYILNSSSSDPSTPKVLCHIKPDAAPESTYYPFSTSTDVAKLTIIQHNTNTNVVMGFFDFSAVDENDSIFRFEGGKFSITYTE